MFCQGLRDFYGMDYPQYVEWVHCVSFDYRICCLNHGWNLLLLFESTNGKSQKFIHGNVNCHIFVTNSNVTVLKEHWRPTYPWKFRNGLWKQCTDKSSLLLDCCILKRTTNNSCRMGEFLSWISMNAFNDSIKVFWLPSDNILNKMWKETSFHRYPF